MFSRTRTQCIGLISVFLFCHTTHSMESSSDFSYYSEKAMRKGLSSSEVDGLYYPSTARTSHINKVKPPYIKQSYKDVVRQQKNFTAGLAKLQMQARTLRRTLTELQEHDASADIALRMPNQCCKAASGWCCCRQLVCVIFDGDIQQQKNDPAKTSIKERLRGTMENLIKTEIAIEKCKTGIILLKYERPLSFITDGTADLAYKLRDKRKK